MLKMCRCEFGNPTLAAKTKARQGWGTQISFMETKVTFMETGKAMLIEASR